MALNLSGTRKRKCAEVCLDVLNIEAVKLFSERKIGIPVASSLECIGFRVGRQLAER